MEEADDELRCLMTRRRALYPVEYASPVSPGGDSIVASLGEMMSPNLPLSRSQHEMIATMVSVENRCFY
jgi:hypothetical protein